MLYESDLELVVKELSPVSEKWRLIGEEIYGVVRVYDIKYSDTTDCLRSYSRGSYNTLTPGNVSLLLSGGLMSLHWQISCKQSIILVS